MKSIILTITFLVLFGFANSQDISRKLQDAVKVLESDQQLKSGMVGFYVINQSDGAVICNINGRVGMPVASSQKVITSIAALELLGTDFQYQTKLSYNGTIENGLLQGNILLSGSGDPTLGSWRYKITGEDIVLNNWMKAIKLLGISRIEGKIIIPNNWGTHTIPGGWLWDDIGNYYGAGSTIVNWHENQYDIKLRSGSKTGDKVNIVSIDPKLYNIQLINELTAGKPGSGDNAYIYLPPYSNMGYIRGTIPPAQSSFTISGSFPDPLRQISIILHNAMEKRGMKVDTSKATESKNLSSVAVEIVTHRSPPLDSINYWFLRKSINLYGEAFTKTLAFVKKKEGSAETGIDIIKAFWKERGIETTSLNMKDGSGLSPQNHITPEALVRAMQYARSKPYFKSFYNALPEFNGIKMKSGTIGGVKSFTGYVNGYTFAVVVNNYNGSTSEVVKKIYRLLDVLK